MALAAKLDTFLKNDAWASPTLRMGVCCLPPTPSMKSSQGQTLEKKEVQPPLSAAERKDSQPEEENGGREGHRSPTT